MVRANACVDVDASAKLDVTLKALIATLAKFAGDTQALAPSLQTGATGEVTATALTDLLSTLQVVLRTTTSISSSPKP